MTTNREEEMQRGFYMVRAMGQSGQEFDHFFDRNIVAVGWSSTDFTEPNKIDQLLRLIEKTYYSDGTDPRVVGRKKSEIRRFMSIRPQDYILVPYYSTVVLARAGSERSYDPSVAKSLDLSNQLQVEYRRVGGEIIQVPRAELTEGLQRRLRVRGSTVSDLREFAGEILGLFCSERPETWKIRVAKAEEDRGLRFVEALVSKLQGGKTNLKAGGLGLEHLVKELLELEGYQARILSKSSFPEFADADIRATRTDRLTGEVELLVQVKHHQGVLGPWGVTQLKEIRRLVPQENNAGLILISSADASNDLLNQCEKSSIQLIAGPELAEWILARVADLRAETRKKLGISSVPEFNLLE